MTDKKSANEFLNPIKVDTEILRAEKSEILDQAILFSTNLLLGHQQLTGESTLSHSDSVCQIVEKIGGTFEIRAAIYLAHGCEVLNKPHETLLPIFGKSLTELAISFQKIFKLQKLATNFTDDKINSHTQVEHVRGMMLTFSKDLRVIMMLLATQLQNLRYVTSQKKQGFDSLASNALEIYSPLANRLGIWQIKWEMEDLAFRILEPDVYKQIAGLLEKKRVDREIEIHDVTDFLDRIFSSENLQFEIQGRPKNIYSIVKKMRGKSLDFAQVFDLRALRIITNNIADCYRCLSLVHQHMNAIENQFDDYIAKPKSNGYQSLHTVVQDAHQKIFEIQIRTRSMHEHAEFGIAAHWAYKESGAKGYDGYSVAFEQAQRMAVLRQLLAWERDITVDAQSKTHQLNLGKEEKIYVLTPDASIIELTNGSTPIDFAYAVHTELGHRCRGAKVDGTLVPLSTTLLNGQTVEIISVKEGGPSRDWLNSDLKFTQSARSKSKVRAWFNFQKSQETIARGRELVEKILQREGKTSLKLDDLAKQLGFETSNVLFEVVGKDEFSLRQIELLWRPQPVEVPDDEKFLRRFQQSKSSNAHGNVLVVGVDSLLTQLAKCCRPAPPDDVKGYVTKGKGISVHRTLCQNFLQLQHRDPERVISVEWNLSSTTRLSEVYTVDVQVIADDRQGLLRDISEVLAREKINVVGVKTHSVKGIAYMTFAIEVLKTSDIHKVLSVVHHVNGVRIARRP
jgi:GTP pyrophosphokinase